MGYRKDIVFQNMQNSFPDKNKAELERMRKAFYQHFCDLIVEMLKMLSVSQKEMLPRCKFTPEASKLFSQLADENKSVILVMGHIGNWEWPSITFNHLCRHRLYAIYHPLGNKYFNGLVCGMRTRFGSRVIPMKSTYKDMLANKADLNATAFIADQTPQPNNAYWTTFLNQDTPVFRGTATIARKLDMPIVYAVIRKVKRGYYVMDAEMLLEHPASVAEDVISELHTRRLERDIIERPETWLWSHRRWKHKRPLSE